MVVSPGCEPLLKSLPKSPGGWRPSLVVILGRSVSAAVRTNAPKAASSFLVWAFRISLPAAVTAAAIVSMASEGITDRRNTSRLGINSSEGRNIFGRDNKCSPASLPCLSFNHRSVKEIIPDIVPDIKLQEGRFVKPQMSLGEDFLVRQNGL